MDFKFNVIYELKELNASEIKLLNDSKPNILYVGFDTEYYSLFEQTPTTISQQFAFILNKRLYGVVYLKKDLQNLFGLKGMVKLPHFISRFFTETSLNANQINQIYLSTHLSRADIRTIFSIKELKNLKNSLEPVEEDIKFFINRNKKVCSLMVLDSHLFNFYGAKSLHTLGLNLGVPKLDLLDSDLENMQLYMERNQQGFYNYALNDSKISVFYLVDNMRIVDEIGLTNEPNIKTASQLAVSYFKKNFSTQYNALNLGLTSKDINKKKGWNEDQILGLGRKHYFGGVSEHYKFGHYPDKIIFDIDLVSAYPVASSILKLTDFNKDKARFVELKHHKEIYNHFKPYEIGDLMGLYEIVFNHQGFMGGRRVVDSEPIMTFRTERDLLRGRGYNHIYRALAGRTYATAFELQHYCNLSSPEDSLYRIDYVKGVEFDLRNSKDYLFKDFMKYTINQRAKYVESNKPLSMAFKNMSNSLTGKVGQGLTIKDIYEFRSNATKQMPICDVTNPFAISSITSYIRILVHIMASCDPKSIFQIATDGVFTEQPIEFYLNNPLFYDNPFVIKYQETLNELKGEHTNILVVKKAADGIFIFGRNHAVADRIYLDFEPINQSDEHKKSWRFTRNEIGLVEKGEKKRVQITIDNIRVMRNDENKTHPNSRKSETHITPAFEHNKRKAYLTDLEFYKQVDSKPFLDEKEAEEGYYKAKKTRALARKLAKKEEYKKLKLVLQISKQDNNLSKAIREVFPETIENKKLFERIRFKIRKEKDDLEHYNLTDIWAVNRYTIQPDVEKRKIVDENNRNKLLKSIE